MYFYVRVKYSVFWMLIRALVYISLCILLVWNMYYKHCTLNCFELLSVNLRWQFSPGCFIFCRNKNVLTIIQISKHSDVKRQRNLSTSDNTVWHFFFRISIIYFYLFIFMLLHNDSRITLYHNLRLIRAFFLLLQWFMLHIVYFYPPVILILQSPMLWYFIFKHLKLYLFFTCF